MGYNTQFEGVLEFKTPLTVQQFSYLSQILNEDCRDHATWREAYEDLAQDDWVKFSSLSYIDLGFETDDDDTPIGLKWNGAEKTYYMMAMINLVIILMNDRFKESFALKGELRAVDDYHERYTIFINEGGWAESKVKQEVTKCPHCGGKL